MPTLWCSSTKTVVSDREQWSHRMAAHPNGFLARVRVLGFKPEKPGDPRNSNGHGRSPGTWGRGCPGGPGSTSSPARHPEPRWRVSVTRVRGPPERFPRGPPKPQALPNAVCINDPARLSTSQQAAQSSHECSVSSAWTGSVAVGQIFSTSPADNLAALNQMPAAVAALLASSPEYLERFQYMPRGEQVQAVSKLVTNLIATWGTASAATRTLQGAAVATAEVPVLSLSAQGALVMGRVAVPVGRAAAVLSGGPGAAIILQRAKGASPSKGPGQWGPVNESMKPPARRYQEQVTGHSADDAYWVGGMSTQTGGVKFDGFKDGVLLEAKGPGYAKFFEGLEPKEWFRNSGAKGLVEQAERQSRKVRGMGIPVRWHVAEKAAADALREFFKNARVVGVEIVHTSAL
ncbi:hypothetical protein HUA74_19660 [Myxococcus sp. CA051A]|nr:hypothetical protein [Myxococcus sp. CA051A]